MAYNVKEPFVISDSNHINDLNNFKIKKPISLTNFIFLVLGVILTIGIFSIFYFDSLKKELGFSQEAIDEQDIIDHLNEIASKEALIETLNQEVNNLNSSMKKYLEFDLQASENCSPFYENRAIESDNIGSKKGSKTDCCKLCQLTPNCRAYTWTEEQSGACWFKSNTGPMIYKQASFSGAIKAYLPKEYSITDLWARVLGKDFWKILVEKGIHNYTCQMSDNAKKSNTIDYVQEGLKSYTSYDKTYIDQGKFCKHVVQEMKAKNNGTWYCIMGEFDSYGIESTGSVLYIRLDHGKTIMIFQTS